MKNIQKGTYGYIEKRRKFEIIKTLLLFMIPLSLFAAGIIATHSRLNILTIVAVLGMLPASKSAVIMIMYIKGHGISKEDYETYEPYMKDLKTSYDNIFTTYEKTFEIPSMVVRCGNVCGISAKKYDSIGALEKHIEATLKQEGYIVNCKIFEKTEQYIERLKSISELTEDEKDLKHAEGIIQVLHDISL